MIWIFVCFAGFWRKKKQNQKVVIVNLPLFLSKGCFSKILFIQVSWAITISVFSWISIIFIVVAQYSTLGPLYGRSISGQTGRVQRIVQGKKHNNSQQQLFWHCYKMKVKSVLSTTCWYVQIYFPFVSFCSLDKNF